MRLVKMGMLSAAMLAIGTAPTNASPVTVGHPFGGAFVPVEATQAVTVANLWLTNSGALSTSPVTGAVITLRLFHPNGTFRLRVVHPNGGGYTATESSPFFTAASDSIQSIPVAVPIQAGDAIGLDLSPGAKLNAEVEKTGALTALWSPPLPDGDAMPPSETTNEIEFGYNAVVLPAPTLASITPAAGPISGGTTVTITGTDFFQVTGVKFGGVRAKTFTQGFNGVMTAVAPPHRAGSADVTVTTVAGTTSLGAADKFTYEACVVPKLNGKKLKAAKTNLKKADCKLGKVTHRKGVTSKTGKVVKQSPKPGRQLAPGSKVKVTLG